MKGLNELFSYLQCAILSRIIASGYQIMVEVMEIKTMALLAMVGFGCKIRTGLGEK